jgi:hypothetical protein
MKKAAKPSKKKTPGARKKPSSRPTKKISAGPAPRMAARRADYGAPVDGFFARQPPSLRPIVDELRRLVEQAAPDATASLKWGMPFYVQGGQTVCALAGFKAHVNLILPGPEGTFPDPDGRLEGDSKLGKHLKLRSLEQLPTRAVRGWLRTAAQRARSTSS